VRIDRNIAAEFLGTFFLVLFGPGAVMVDAWSGGRLGQLGIALAFGCVVAAMVFALGDVSGAHINPAVTFAQWTRGRISGRHVVPYVLSQCAGAALASLALRAALGTAGNSGATLPAIPVTYAFAVEFALSFVLMEAVAASGEPGRASAAPWAVGLAVGLCALVGGPLTGASMNPARSFGPALIGGEWRAHWIYWLAPLAGMLAAGRLHDLLRRGSAVGGQAALSTRPHPVHTPRR
jgi:MIP family channel proteins